MSRLIPNLKVDGVPFWQKIQGKQPYLASFQDAKYAALLRNGQIYRETVPNGGVVLKGYLVQSLVNPFMTAKVQLQD
jgi:hypothetical protein